MKRKKIKLNLEDFGLDSFLAAPSLDQLNMIGGESTSNATLNTIECTVTAGTGGTITCVTDFPTSLEGCPSTRADCWTLNP